MLITLLGMAFIVAIMTNPHVNATMGARIFLCGGPLILVIVGIVVASQ